MTTFFKVSSDTEQYFNAQRSLVLSNGDQEFKDKTNHSDDLVLDVIDSYYNVVVLPMFSKIDMIGK